MLLVFVSVHGVLGTRLVSGVPQLGAAARARGDGGSGYFIQQKALGAVHFAIAPWARGDGIRCKPCVHAFACFRATPPRRAIVAGPSADLFGGLLLGRARRLGRDLLEDTLHRGEGGLQRVGELLALLRGGRGGASG